MASMTTYNKCKNLRRIVLQLFLYLFLGLFRSSEEYKIFDSSIVLQLFDIVAFVPFSRFVQAFHRIMLLLKCSASSSLFSCFKKSYICFEIYVTNKINRSLNIVGFTKRDGKKLKHLYLKSTIYRVKWTIKKHTLKTLKSLLSWFQYIYND